MLFSLFTILPFATCLFWTVVLLLDWRRDNIAQHVLVGFMGACSLLYLCHAAFFNHESSAVTESIYAFCNIGVFPLYFLYISRLTNTRGLSVAHLAVLLPAVAMGIWAVLQTLFLPDDASAKGVRELVTRVIFMAQLVPICIICFRRLRAFDIEISNYYADTEKRTVRPTERMMSLLLGASLISGIANFMGRDYFNDTELLIGVPSVLFSIILFGVGYVGCRQEFCIDDLLKDEGQLSSDDSAFSKTILPSDSTPESLPEPSIAEDPETLSHIISRLDDLMGERRLFLQPDLRLSEVASMIGVGRTTLSQRINQELHISFSDYVNNLRVDYACRILDSDQGKRVSLSAIAEMSGFSSDSSFYRAFRRHIGMTPKQYAENC